MASGDDKKNIDGLDLPQEGSTDWAGDLDDFCTAIDEHDHTPGKGKPITEEALSTELAAKINAGGGGGGGGLSTVSTDPTLKGDGSTETPLGLADTVNTKLAEIDSNKTEVDGYISALKTRDAEITEATQTNATAIGVNKGLIDANEAAIRNIDEGHVADLSGVRGGSDISVTHSPDNLIATVNFDREERLLPTGGAIGQSLAKNGTDDFAVDWITASRTYEYVCSFDQPEEIEGTNRLVTTELKIDISDGAEIQTPPFNGKTPVSASATGGHLTIPAGYWTATLALFLGNANIQGVTLNARVGESTVLGSSDGFIDDAGLAHVVLNFETSGLTTDVVFELVTTGGNFNVRLGNNQAGTLHLRDGVGKPLTIPEGFVVEGMLSDAVQTKLNASSGGGVPDGGDFRVRLGQVLGKRSNTDQDTTWTWPSLTPEIQFTPRTLSVTTVDSTRTYPLGASANDPNTIIRNTGSHYNNAPNSFEIAEGGWWNVSGFIYEGLTNISAVAILIKNQSGGALVAAIQATRGGASWHFAHDFFLGVGTNLTLEVVTHDGGIQGTGHTVKFSKGVSSPILSKSITGGQLADDTVVEGNLAAAVRAKLNAGGGGAVADKSITLPKLEDAFEYVDNGGTIQKDKTATEEYMHVYKQNQNLDTSLPSADRPDQWVHARLGGKFKLSHVQIGTNLNTARLDYALDLENEAIRHQHIANPLNIDNFVGATVLEAGVSNDGSVLPTALDSGDWVTEAGTAPGFVFKSNVAGFTINRGRTPATRTVTHLLVRTGRSVTAKQGGDVLRKLAINPENSGSLAINDEKMIPITHTYAPPVPSPTNPAIRNRGTGIEYSAYSVVLFNADGDALTIGIRLGETSFGSVIVDVIGNSTIAIPDGAWISFHLVRGIGG